LEGHHGFVVLGIVAAEHQNFLGHELSPKKPRVRPTSWAGWIVESRQLAVVIAGYSRPQG
jgi:hypothetical protein